MMKGCRDLARLRIEAINKNSLFAIIALGCKAKHEPWLLVA